MGKEVFPVKICFKKSKWENANTVHRLSLCSNTSENSCCGLTAPSGAPFASGHRGHSQPGRRGSGPWGPFSFLLPHPVSVQPAPSLKGHGSHGVTLHACSRALASFCPWTAGARGRACRCYSIQRASARCRRPLPEPRPVSLSWGLAALAPPAEVTAPSWGHCRGRLSPSHSAD